MHSHSMTLACNSIKIIYRRCSYKRTKVQIFTHSTHNHTHLLCNRGWFSLCCSCSSSSNQHTSSESHAHKNTHAIIFRRHHTPHTNIKCLRACDRKSSFVVSVVVTTQPKLFHKYIFSGPRLCRKVENLRGPSALKFK